VDSNLLQTLLTGIANPDTAATKIEQLMASLGLYQSFHTVGMAAIALFALTELYRIMFQGGERELAMLAGKIAVVAYLITGSPSPLEQLVKAAYHPFAEFGNLIATAGAGTAFNDLVTALNSILNAPVSGPGVPLWEVFASLGSSILNIALALGLWFFFVIVFMIVLAIYVFTVLGSRVFVVIAIMVAPLILPFMLWRPVANFMSKWVGVVLHAFFMPVVGAITLTAALDLGIAAPIQEWAKCVTSAPPGTGAVHCIGTQTASLVVAIIGGLVAVFLMLSVDRVVTGFIGAAEVSASGLLAARWTARMAAAPLRAMKAAQVAQARQENAMRPRAEVVMTDDLQTGKSSVMRRITAPVETPQM